jgi:ArsR family transcriptional regulator
MATILRKPQSNGETNRGRNVQPDSNSSIDSARLPEAVAKELVRLFKLLSDETRLRILYFLHNNKELNVRSLCDLLSQSQPAVSHHLALLKVDGLIDCRRQGKHNFYRLEPKRFEHLLGMVVGKDGAPNTQLRFDDWVLSVTQSNGPA